MFQPVIIVFIALLPIVSAIFWDVLNCPLCYLPRIDWPGVTSPYPYSYPAAYPAYSAPAAAPVVYSQQAPVVKYVRPVQYVYQYPPRQQVITVQRPAATYSQQPAVQQTYQSNYHSYNQQSNGYSQPSRAPYRLSQAEISRHQTYSSGGGGGGYRTGGGYGSTGYGSSGYSGSNGGYQGGSSAQFGSEAEFSQQAPYAKKLTAALGRAGGQNRKGSGGRSGGELIAPKPTTTTTTTTTEEPLVEWEDSQKGSQQSTSVKEEHKSIKEGHEGSEKNFHIHEEHTPSGGRSKGKGSIDDDLDDLDEDILTSGGKTGKPAASKPDDIIVADVPKSPKMRDDRNEFIPIGKDKRRNKVRRVKPAPPPKNLVDRHNKELRMTAALTAAWEQKKAEIGTNGFHRTCCQPVRIPAMDVLSLIIVNLLILIPCSVQQGAYYPNHWYGANQGNIRSGIVPEFGPAPYSNAGTLAPHVCGFNPYTRKCMDPENHCPGRCMNFRYTYNTLYDCRCLVI